MTRALITVELLPNDTSGERLMQTLDATLAEQCHGLSCSLVRRPDFPVGKTFDDGVELAVRNVVNAMPPLSADHPNERRWGVYLSPRRMEFFVNQQAIEHQVNGVVTAVALDGTPVAIFLHTIAIGEVREEIAEALEAKMWNARERLILKTVSPAEGDTIDRLIGAVSAAYRLTFTANHEMN
jgi:hypothetical protein